MKWLGILAIVFGALLFCSLTAFEKSLPLVQFVEEEQVVSEPMHLVLPQGTQFIKGNGKNGARFVDIHSEAVNYIPTAKFLGLSKLGGLAICILGAVGFTFERMRERARRDYLLSKPGEIETNGSD